jgi:CspA family cold shock protein
MCNPSRPQNRLGFFLLFFIRKEHERMTQGTVKFFNPTKGFGFITTEQGEEIFFHKSNVKNTGFRDVLVQGDQVQFELKQEQKGKRAYNIVRV